MRHGVFQLLITTQFIADQELSRNKLRKKQTNSSIYENAKQKTKNKNTEIKFCG